MNSAFDFFKSFPQVEAWSGKDGETVTKFLKIFLLIPVILIISSCKDNPAGYLFSPFDTSRIVPGLRMEGIYPGDSNKKVEELLGKDHDLGWGDGGSNKSWIIYKYTSGEHNGFSAWFIEKFDTEGKPYPGPVDFLVADTPYTGKTRDGIGIGSNIQAVHKIFGDPYKSSTPGSYKTENYCIRNMDMFIRYHNDTIEEIKFRLFDESVKTPCK